MPAPSALGTFFKTPDERKRYSIYYGDWLDTAETVLSTTFTVSPSGDLEVDAYSIDADGTSLVFFVNAGADETDYTINVKSVTSGGQTKEDELFVSVRAF